MKEEDRKRREPSRLNYESATQSFVITNEKVPWPTLVQPWNAIPLSQKDSKSIVLVAGFHHRWISTNFLVFLSMRIAICILSTFFVLEKKNLCYYLSILSSLLRKTNFPVCWFTSMYPKFSYDVGMDQDLTLLTLSLTNARS